MNKHTSGFTIIELLIAIAIIGILTTIALPSYQKYSRKAHYLEIVQATSPFKLGIEECFQITGELKNCQPGKNGVPKNISSSKGLIDKISVNSNAEIIVIPNNLYGIKKTDDYILKPEIKNDRLVWKSSGGGVNEGYAK